MANSNVLDISKEWREASASIEAHNAAIREAIALLPQLGKGYSAPSESIAKMAQATGELEKVNQKRIKSTQDTEKAMERQRLAEIKLAQDRERAFDKYEKQLLRESERQIKESEKIIRQKEKEFREFEKQFNKYEADLRKKAIEEERAKKATVQAILDESKALQSLQRQKEKALKDAEREEAKLKTAENLYNKVQAKMNAFANEYKALAIKKELGIKLTNDEEKAYNRLQGRIQNYDKALKAVDASMGKYQRNVGNYASGFNPLSNSFQQLAREAPAFANSVQTGFMALSNNLPIFFDAISQTRDEIKRLRADGQQVPSLFQQLTASVLSWGTALSVGVTLLTVYGDEIVDAIFNTKAKAKADEEAKKKVEEKNEAEQRYIDTIKSSAAEEQSRARILIENAKNEALPMRERLKAIDDLQERYPAYFGNLSKQQILSGQVTEAENALNEALVKRGLALGLQTKLTEKYNELAGVMIRINSIQQRSAKLNADDIKLAQKLGVTQAQAFKDKELVAKLSLRQAGEQQKAIEEEINGIIKLFNENSKYIGIVNESTKAKNANTEATKKANEENAKSTNDLLSKNNLQNAISGLEEVLNSTSRLSPAYDTLNGTLQRTKDLFELLYGDGSKAKEGKDELRETITLTAEDLYEEYYAWLKLKQATDDYIASLSQLAVNQGIDALGLQSLKIFTDLDANGMSTFDKLIAGADSFKEKFAITFQAVGDVAQNVFNMIANASNQRFAEERQRLDEQFAYQKQFVNGNAEAEAELITQMERKKREIANREAKAKRDQTIFNILMNTAQGVTAALATVPPNPVLAGIIGALGAAQLAMASSVQLPQYYKGRKGGKRELAWTDERGAEIHVDKSGRIKDFGSNRGARLKMLDEGDSIYTAEESTKILSRMRSVGSDKGNAPVIIEKQVATETTEINIDKNGIFATIRKGSQNAQLVNNHLRIRKRNV